jgi:hypothetical protein
MRKFFCTIVAFVALCGMAEESVAQQQRRQVMLDKVVAV